MHVYPRFAEAIAAVLQEYGISKVRFPSEDMDEVGWMNNNPRKPFRQTIYRNVASLFLFHPQTLQSIPLYNKHGVYGGYGIGSSIGGNCLSVQRILNCCMRYPRRNGYVTTIELMVLSFSLSTPRPIPAVPSVNLKNGGVEWAATASASTRTVCSSTRS